MAFLRLWIALEKLGGRLSNRNRARLTAFSVRAGLPARNSRGGVLSLLAKSLNLSKISCNQALFIWDFTRLVSGKNSEAIVHCFGPVKLILIVAFRLSFVSLAQLTNLDEWKSHRNKHNHCHQPTHGELRPKKRHGRRLQQRLRVRPAFPNLTHQRSLAWRSRYILDRLDHRRGRFSGESLLDATNVGISQASQQPLRS